MTRDPIGVREDDDLETVVELMERRRVKRFPVLRGGKIVGIVSRANLMRALVSLARFEEAPPAATGRYANSSSRPSPSSRGCRT